MNTSLTIAPGARVIIRDAEWVVRKIEKTSNSDREITCEGISELVKGKTGIFIEKLEGFIEVLDPAETALVCDTSQRYIKSLLFMESALRSHMPNNDKLLGGHKGAMDLVQYQLQPALQALKQPRQRILIADAVGLGKTLEAGILVSELIRRGRGRRILVVTLKSMLTQFQKEFWNRFTIPLVRLDSVGIARIRSRIPANHNPFYFFEKTIISMDTLKGDLEYRNYIENAYWDIIIIDECHNVAERGSSSKRAHLAKLLSRRSDTLIMLSATPHDGRAKSFASLLNMLDPTAIADTENYSKNDFFNKGLVIRRFKKDIIEEVRNAFQDRKVDPVHIKASVEEDKAYDKLLSIPFTTGGKHLGGKNHELLRVGFQKAVFSSPAAAIKSINERLAKLSAETLTEDEQHEAEGLNELKELLGSVTADKYTKYQKLINYLNGESYGWSPKKKDDRLVIFSERIETIKFLYEQLIKDLRLKEDAIELLHGSLSDQEQQRIVEDFGKDNSPLRVLLCSDVASEGINLHYLCHRMIHFDMPWSLMVFQQRNGRIDRYGQNSEPLITYLITESKNDKIRGDMRILEILMKKDQQAYKNIGDPSVFMSLYDSQKEEQAIINDMAEGVDAKVVDEKYQPPKTEEDFLAKFMAINENSVERSPEVKKEKIIHEAPQIFQDDYKFFKESAQLIIGDSAQWSCNDERSTISITVPQEFETRITQLPQELELGERHFLLTTDKETIKDEINRSRQDETAWPKIHYLWPQHPVMEWIINKASAVFGRHSAPVIKINNLQKNEQVFIISGLIPNQKGQPLVYDWHAVKCVDFECVEVRPFEEFSKEIALGSRNLINDGVPFDTSYLKPALKNAIEATMKKMAEKRTRFEKEINEKLSQHYNELERLKSRQYEQLNLFLEQSKSNESIKEKQHTERKKEIEDIFDEYLNWIQTAMTTEETPYLQVVAVFVSDK